MYKVTLRQEIKNSDGISLKEFDVKGFPGLSAGLKNMVEFHLDKEVFFINQNNILSIVKIKNDGKA